MPGATGHLSDDEEDGPFSILDICTGSGCIAWSLAAEFPEAMVYGCDLSEAALRYACKQRVKVRGAKPIFFSADALLRPDGHLYLEINERFGPEVAALFPGSRLFPDISGRDRFVVR